VTSWGDLVEMQSSFGHHLDQITETDFVVEIPNLQLTNLDDLQWLPANTIRGVQSLQVEW